MAMQFIGEFFGGVKQGGPGHIWQDREIRFDVGQKELVSTTSEFDIETLVRPWVGVWEGVEPSPQDSSVCAMHSHAHGRVCCSGDFNMAAVLLMP